MLRRLWPARLQETQKEEIVPDLKESETDEGYIQLTQTNQSETPSSELKESPQASLPSPVTEPLAASPATEPLAASPATEPLVAATVLPPINMAPYPSSLVFKSHPNIQAAGRMRNIRESNSGSETDDENNNLEHFPPLELQPHYPHSALTYQKLYNYAYYAGVLQSSLWSNIFTMPVLIEYGGMTLGSAAFAKLLLLHTEIDEATFIDKEIEKKVLLYTLGAALTTHSLQLLCGNQVGFWAAPLIMVSAKTAAATIEKNLPQVASYARNLASLWNRRPAPEDCKKFDGEPSASRSLVL
ncbi:MAG TPA: hypothetical protein VLH77_06790 [Gammaproteobacteria bacterium]|nr:hypothetical protein [Gammaproteobacteria bacterium]